MKTNPHEKENTVALKFAHLAPEIWEGLAGVPRTGWVDRKVKNPETVQQHTISLKQLAQELSEKLEDFSEEEKEELLDMLEIHDWSEAIDGDEVIYTFDEQEKKTKKELKFIREKQTMTNICEHLGEVGEKIMALWMRFETSQDKVASFARQLDKHQAIEKAAEYEAAQGIPLFREFYEYSQKDVFHPLLLERLEKLKK
jgi:5'-deoxynucleotidase YfbR-like HD superfamily hydrolase